jgi:hypothetical protein
MVRAHLEASVPLSVGGRVISEPAEHLEEAYEDARARGFPEASAMKLARQEVKDWRVLAADIRDALSEEDHMNNRTKSHWLPAMVHLLAAM